MIIIMIMNNNTDEDNMKTMICYLKNDKSFHYSDDKIDSEIVFLYPHSNMTTVSKAVI